MPLLCPRCRKRIHVPQASGPDPSAEGRAAPALDRCPEDGTRLVPDRAGLRIDAYIVDDFLGIGGAGTVWRAHADGAAGHPVALKLLAPNGDGEAQRFERGARLVGGLEHPHIARTLAHGRTEGPDGEPFLFAVMELLEGETLSALQARVRRFAPAEVARVGSEILSALEHAHARSIVHRDLKTSNLFVDASGAVKLLDFGIAKLAGQERVPGPFFPEDEAVGEEVTGQQKICGTPEYMAPEQIVGAATDPRSDLYAVGVVLYKLLTGALPFRGRARAEIYDQHLRAPPPALPAELDAPEALVRVIQRALAKRPEDRFPSARAMHDALRAAVGLAPLPPDAASAPALTPIFPPTRPGEPRPAASPAIAALPASIEAPLPQEPAPPGAPGARSRRRVWAVGFFVASLLVLVTVVVTRLA